MVDFAAIAPLGIRALESFSVVTAVNDPIPAFKNPLEINEN
ncbi:hypothetical protein [Rhizobium sp. P28RR-XV]|nr:hypothetical protein [Rhizobium sp. P28RR-XV]